MTKEISTGSYAIFKTGGKQYQAVVGKTIQIEKLDTPAGEHVVFNDVLLRKTAQENDGEDIIEVGQPFLEKPVQASIIKHIRGPKIVIFRFKRRKKYKKKAGHRQPYTVIRIEAI